MIHWGDETFGMEILSIRGDWEGGGMEQGGRPCSALARHIVFVTCYWLRYDTFGHTLSMIGRIRHSVSLVCDGRYIMLVFERFVAEACAKVCCKNSQNAW